MRKFNNEGISYKLVTCVGDVMVMYSYPVRFLFGYSVNWFYAMTTTIYIDARPQLVFYFYLTSNSILSCINIFNILCINNVCVYKYFMRPCIHYVHFYFRTNSTAIG